MEKSMAVEVGLNKPTKEQDIKAAAKFKERIHDPLLLADNGLSIWLMWSTMMLLLMMMTMTTTRSMYGIPIGIPASITFGFILQSTVKQQQHLFTTKFSQYYVAWKTCHFIQKILPLLHGHTQVPILNTFIRPKTKVKINKLVSFCIPGDSLTDQVLLIKPGTSRK
ncbi:hypothetical protein FF38_12301 [Lucilia cuprina]|uniref:Uncharacterized protein n=1 Tax=Lucilia cuprina TaxID=7375 RepID=A0A0L0CUE5_LUCCU|nr:hypothetical protein FF38_12301 [Lucilia cuprina]